MKKRNVISVILAIALVVLTCATFAACDKTPQAPTTYTVSFTGENVSIEAKVVNSGETVQKPENPTRDGFTFGGWLLNGEAFSFDTPITSDITLVAKWIENSAEVEEFTVAFSGDGINIPSKTVAKGETVDEPAEPTRENFTFKGWYLGETKFDFSTPVTSNITLVAKWEENIPDTVTVTFSGEGVNTPAQIVMKGDTALEPVSPVLDGFEFIGWYLGDAEFDFDTPVNEDITLVAKWLEKEPASMTGKGTMEDPYVLWTANDIINFSSRVNGPSTAGNEGYYKAWYRLGK